MGAPIDDLFLRWFAALEGRHLGELTFAEVRRALQALSTLYVHERRRVRSGAALQGAGKRAASALFYAPLHFLTVRAILGELGTSPPPAHLLELGCGSGAAGAAWALTSTPRPELRGVDLNPWVVDEANWNWRWFQLGGRARVGRIERERLPGAASGILLAYVVNEIEAQEREPLLDRLLEAVGRGARLLVVEPIARRVTPWWDEWAEAFRREGGRADTWRFPAELPERLGLLDRAAGLDHRELTARTLSFGFGGARRSRSATR